MPRKPGKPTSTGPLGLGCTACWDHCNGDPVPRTYATVTLESATHYVQAATMIQANGGSLFSPENPNSAAPRSMSNPAHLSIVPSTLSCVCCPCGCRNQRPAPSADGPSRNRQPNALVCPPRTLQLRGRSQILSTSQFPTHATLPPLLALVC